LDNIPLEDQLVIDELVEFWQTNDEPRNLTAHIRGTLKQGCTSLTWFFAKVRDDLRTDKHSKYTASSVFEFRQFLEVEYRRLYQPCAERQQAEAQAKAEKERRARADFDALGKEMAKATTRAELVELGRKREKLAPYTGNKHVYENVCWCCHSRISSTIHARCLDCGWYICSSCGSCSHVCNKTYKSVFHDEAVDPFLPDFPDDI